MKSTKEWANYFNSNGADITDVEIKEVQLDAIKEGLQMAQQIIENYYECPSTQEYKMIDALQHKIDTLKLE